jgi:putative nucleotidyltransferase with HDIG domain
MVSPKILQRKEDRVLDRLAASKRIRAESDVKGSCFDLLDTCALRFNKALRPVLYDGLPWPYDGPWEDVQRLLCDPLNVAPHRVWNQVVDNFELRHRQHPLAMQEAGRAVEHLGKWGLTDQLRRALGRFADIKEGWKAVRVGNKAWNNNKFWSKPEFRVDRGQAIARLTVQIRNRELGLDHNIDTRSYLFWLAIASSVPNVWGQPHAVPSVIDVQFDIQPYLQFFQERLAAHALTFRIEQVELVGDELVINDEVYGQWKRAPNGERLLSAIGQPVVAITRDLKYAGDVNILTTGQTFGAEQFTIDFAYQPLALAERFRRKLHRFVGRLGSQDRDEFVHQLNPQVECALALQQLELDDQHLLTERLAAQDQAAELRRLSEEARMAAAIRIASDYERYNGHTTEHIYRVAGRARSIAQCLGGFSDDELYLLERAGWLHDLGKWRVPLRILEDDSPHGLDPEDLVIMRRHTIYGYELATEAGFDPLIANVIRWHHETLDGKGYPDGRVGSQIPLVVQIIQLSDIFDALTMKRSYKKAWTIDEALEWLAVKMVKTGKMDRVLFETALPVLAEDTPALSVPA